ncbi:MAG TPA: glycosyltransferase family 4 protein [Acidimicrobiia bacterium]|jgi:glycosyltransferase involved in cell wall biosynthesis|nr:glycosyltransferase family 4 protein [Acidimicrobiia bacterium]
MRNRSNHILFIVENNDVPYDRRVWLEATTLKEAGHDVSVVCPRSQRSRRRIEKLEGVRIIRHPRLVEAARPWQYLFEYTNALFWEILVALFLVVTHHVDVVHIANPPDAAFVLGPLLRFAGARIVFDQHDMSPEIYEDKFGRRDLVWRALRWCERQSIRFADLVITPNESMKRLASERAGKDPEAVHVVRNGPKLEAATETTEDPGLRNGRQYLVTYMGIIGEQEGLDGLVRVIDDIVHVRGRTDVQFAVIGDGTGLPAVREDVRSRGLDDYVTFTGYLTGDAFMKALGSADVCVCPEPPTFLNQHSTLIKLMDYMSLSKPVVAYDLVEARVTGGDCVRWVPAGDEAGMASEILRLLDDADERKSLGYRAGERAATVLAWDKQAPHLLDAYEKLMKGTRDA